MLRNTEIDDVMTAILLKLMPLSTKGTNHELWNIHNQLQEWKLNVKWEYPNMETDRASDIAQSVLKKLEILPDRPLADKIGFIIKRHTSHH